MRKLKYLLFILVILFSINSYAATLYMCGTGATCGDGWSNGSDSNDGSSKSTPKLTLVGSFAAMSGGDTLIVGIRTVYLLTQIPT